MHATLLMSVMKLTGCYNKPMKLPVLFQRIEGGALFVAVTFIYWLFGLDMGLFLLLFFSFDISILGYLVNPRVGAISYNAVHSFVGPSALLAIGLYTSSIVACAYALIWFAHLGFDRMIGFGLMHPDEFGNSHLDKKQLPKAIRRLLK